MDFQNQWRRGQNHDERRRGDIYRRSGHETSRGAAFVWLAQSHLTSKGRSSHGLLHPFTLFLNAVEAVTHVDKVRSEDADPARCLVRSMVLQTKGHSFVIHFPSKDRFPAKFYHLVLLGRQNEKYLNGNSSKMIWQKKTTASTCMDPSSLHAWRRKALNPKEGMTWPSLRASQPQWGKTTSP